ncbi:MAG: hypothetical protein ACI9GW_002466 [Halieaceae bacterium]|jgi:hypothetical protein
MTEACANTHLTAGAGRALLALLGLIIALFGSNLQRPSVGGGGVLVWVNHQPITSVELNFASEKLEANSSESLSVAQRQAVLELLVDEELLLQRADSLGVYTSDRGIRKTVVHGVIDREVAEFLGKPTNDHEIRQFYREHRSVFEHPLRAEVDIVRFTSVHEAERARVAMVAGVQPEDSIALESNAALSHLPQAPLPEHMLRRYLGSALTEVALGLEQGEISGPISRPEGVYLISVQILEPAWVPDFDYIRENVVDEYHRRGRDRALEQTLARLWQDSDVRFNIDVTAGALSDSGRKRQLLDSSIIETEYQGAVQWE